MSIDSNDNNEKEFTMKKFMKKSVASALAATMLFASVFPVAAQAIEMPQYVPIRSFFEAVGAEVDWVDSQVIVSINGDEWVLTPGTKEAMLNSEEMTLASPVTLADGRAMISFDDAALLFAGASDFPQTAVTAVLTATQLMEQAGVNRCDYSSCRCNHKLYMDSGFRLCRQRK